MKSILSKSLHALTLILSALLLFVMASCGGGGSGSSMPSGIQGVAQKGPFIKGSRVFIQELDANLVPTGIAYETTTTDDQGSFDLASSLSANLVEVSITGYYFNEVTGTLSGGPQTLRMISDLTQDNAANVNVLTQLSVSRIRNLVASGLSLDEASIQAKSEVLALFNIDAALMTEDFEQLDLSGPGIANASLLYASAVLLQGRTEAEAALLLAELELDLEQNGTVDNPLLQQQVTQSMATVNLTSILNNLSSYYTGIGTTIDPPDVVGFEREMDVTPPILESITPADASIDVAVDTTLELVFSEEMDPASLPGNILLRDVSGAIDCTIATHGRNVTVTPIAKLAYSTWYQLEVGTGAADLGGNTMEVGKSASFTTEAIPDLTPPTLLSTTPLHGAVDVKVGAVIELVFSEDLDPASIAGAIDLSDGSASLAFVTDLKGATLRLAPVNQFALNQTYWLHLNQQITDLAKNPLASTYQISFTTEQPPMPSCGLQVTDVNPGEDQNATSVHRALTIHFNMELDKTSIHRDSLWIYGPDGVVHGRISVDDNIISFKPFRDLKHSTNYELHLKDAMSETGESLCGEVYFSFTTKDSRKKHRDH